MFWIILVMIVVLIILVKTGVLRKKRTCQHCGKMLKGPQQKIIGETGQRIVLCKDCYELIDPTMQIWADEHWKYSDYEDYLEWMEDIREDVAAFSPEYRYGKSPVLAIDTQHHLFAFEFGQYRTVYRFSDVLGYDINFQPTEIKEGVFSTKVKGHEYIKLFINRPSIEINYILRQNVYCKLKESALFSNRIPYELAENFQKAVLLFSINMIMANQEEQEDEAPSFDEMQKALALFMFDCVEDVTEETLKKQRNTLVKAFHPDKGEADESYCQKINAAYEVLSDYLRNKKKQPEQSA